MKKIYTFYLFVILLGLVSCNSSSGKLDLGVENGHFRCTPKEVIEYLNSQNKNTNYYTISDFASSGEKIAICEDGETADIYLTFVTKENGKIAQINIELYVSATEKSTESFMQYLTLLFSSITGDADQMSNALKPVSNLISGDGTGFILIGVEDISISGGSNPGVYTVNISAKEEE